MHDYHIHDMRHYLAHLLRCQPDLAEILAPQHRPEDAEDPIAWTQRLPHRQLVEICSQWVQETLSRLKDANPPVHTMLRYLVALPDEWNIDDACALLLDDAESEVAAGREQISAAIRNALELGLLAPGKGQLRYLVPFPVRFSLQSKDPLESYEQEILRQRLVSHFSRMAMMDFDQDPTFRASWRLSNYLYVFHLAVLWLEELSGQKVASLFQDNLPPVISTELAEALARFGKALGANVARRRSDQGWRSLMGAIIGARTLSHRDLEGDLYRLLGHYFRQTGQLCEAARCLDRSRRLYLQLADAHKACLTGSALALTLRDQGFPEKALREFENAWMLACEHGLTGEKLSIANCAGELCLKVDQPTQAREWFLRGWKAAQKENPVGDLAEVCNNIGRALRAEGRSDEALQWFSEALRISRQESHRPSQASSYGEIARIWEERGDYAGAIVWLERSLALRRELTDESGQARLLCDLSRCARLDHRLGEALEWATRGRALARRHGLVSLTGEICLEMAEQALIRRDDIAAREAFMEALEHLGPTAPGPLLARIHFRLALILHARLAHPRAAFHMLAAQALGRHSRLNHLLTEIDPWLRIFTDLLGAAPFEAIIEQVSDQWESGELGGRTQETPRSSS